LTACYMFRLLDQPPEASTKINIYVNQNLLIIRNTFFLYIRL